MAAVVLVPDDGLTSVAPGGESMVVFYAEGRISTWTVNFVILATFPRRPSDPSSCRYHRTTKHTATVGDWYLYTKWKSDSRLRVTP